MYSLFFCFAVFQHLRYKNIIENYRNKKRERTTKECLTLEERKEKQVAIKHLYGELYERLEDLGYKPDNLCKAYLAIIESMQNQLGERDIINEAHDFVDLNKIGIEILMQAFSFFFRYDSGREESDNEGLQKRRV